jgi:aryl-alcohol dehydrogenase-like predicted oxidoreductase
MAATQRQERVLGSSGIGVSALGLGCWAIGGPYWREGKPMGWGKTDDAESIHAVRLAVDLGVTFFDTADVYGCGHSERIIGRALAGIRERVVIATKFGRTFDARSRRVTGTALDAASIRRACEASLRRLRRDRIDLYLLHLGTVTVEQAAQVREVLEGLREQGTIGAYGWSTDASAAAGVFAQGRGCAALQHTLNVFERNDAMLALCEARGLASIARSPLAMGLLTGKLASDTSFAADDVRRHELDLRGAPHRDRLLVLEEIGELLRAGGRTLAQGALGWIWARSERAIPIPGARTRAQVRENAGALSHGALDDATMRAIEDALSRAGGTPPKAVRGAA